MADVATAVESPVIGPPVPPSWLDASFMEKSLRSEHPDVSVTSVHVEAAVAAGENYACVVYRALVQSNLGQFRLVLKCLPEAEFRAKFVREMGIMERELRMYERTLPMLRGSASHPNFPHCFPATREAGSDATLVLRDMRSLGYSTRNRQLGLDVAHCKLALTELAHLHGLSVALRIQEPAKFKTEIQDLYVDTFYTEETRDKMSQFINATFQGLAEAVKFRLPYRFHSIANLMIEMNKISYTELINVVKLPEDITDKVIVLNHGDFWSNNILFQYEENDDEPIACSMIDFQISRSACPSLDLLYFFFTSTTQATRRAHMDGLLTLYLDEARKAMRERGVDDPGNMFYKDVTELRKAMRRNAVFGFQSACFVLPIVIADAKDVPDMDSFTEEDFKKMESSPFLKMYAGPLFCSRFRELLEDFDDMGYFVELRKKLDSLEE